MAFLVAFLVAFKEAFNVVFTMLSAVVFAVLCPGKSMVPKSDWTLANGNFFQDQNA